MDWEYANPDDALIDAIISGIKEVKVQEMMHSKSEE